MEIEILLSIAHHTTAVMAKVTEKESGSQTPTILDIPANFVKEGTQFLSKCQKPDMKEYSKIVRAVGIGFVSVGIIGYAIKLIHIPIRYVIV